LFCEVRAASPTNGVLPHVPGFYRLLATEITALETACHRCFVCLDTQSIPLPDLLQLIPGQSFCFCSPLRVCISYTKTTGRSRSHRRRRVWGSGLVPHLRRAFLTKRQSLRHLHK